MQHGSKLSVSELSPLAVKIHSAQSNKKALARPRVRIPPNRALSLRRSIFRCAHLTAHPCAPCNTSGTRPRRPVGRWLCNIDNIERQRGIIFTSSVHTTAERASEDRAVMHHALGHLSELHLCGWPWRARAHTSGNVSAGVSAFFHAGPGSVQAKSEV